MIVCDNDVDMDEASVNRVLDRLLAKPLCADGQHDLEEIPPTTNKPGWHAYRCRRCPHLESTAHDPVLSGLHPDKFSR